MRNDPFSFETMCSLTCGLHPRASTKSLCKAGLQIAEDKEFSNLFNTFISTGLEKAINGDITDFQTPLYMKAYSILKSNNLIKNMRDSADHERIFWCAITKVSDQYFSKIAKKYKWADSEKDEIVRDWYRIMKTRFIYQHPVPHNSADTRALHSSILNWYKRFHYAVNGN